ASTCFFFFFQAEDGIRDFHVTGVQTCALPICASPANLQFLLAIVVFLRLASALRLLLLHVPLLILLVYSPSSSKIPFFFIMLPSVQTSFPSIQLFILYLFVMYILQ